MKYGFIQEPQKAYPATVLCSVMQVGRTPHAWAKRPEATGKDRERRHGFNLQTRCKAVMKTQSIISVNLMRLAH